MDVNAWARLSIDEQATRICIIKMPDWLSMLEQHEQYEEMKRGR